VKILCVDVDDTICFTQNRDYERSVPNQPVIEKLREARSLGYTIILHTARGQGRSNNNVHLVADEVMDEVEAFCARFDVPYDSIVLNKPLAIAYIDDKAMRPDEFLKMNL
jgi:capsule biosynthesis phosphatase